MNYVLIGIKSKKKHMDIIYYIYFNNLKNTIPKLFMCVHYILLGLFNIKYVATKCLNDFSMFTFK